MAVGTHVICVISTFSVPFALNDFRRQILGCTAQSPRAVRYHLLKNGEQRRERAGEHFRAQVCCYSPSRACDSVVDLRKSEIGDFDMPFAVDQKILRLEVTISDVMLVAIFERQHNLLGVEAPCRVTESVHLTSCRRVAVYKRASRRSGYAWM